MNRLMLGSGANRREGWVRLDANPVYQPDILATIPPLPRAVTRRQWNEIEWIHGIEHFYPWEAEELLPKLREVLAPGGRLVLEQPNFIHCCEAQNLRWIFGDSTFRDPLYGHRWGYTPRSLCAALKAAGFRRVLTGPVRYHNFPERDFRMEAYK